MFKYHIFNVAVHDGDNEQQLLNHFLTSHKILHVEKHFVMDAGQSFWSFCVQYADQQPSINSGDSRKPRVDYREVLNADEFAIYAALRELRKQIAESEGVPVFAIFTNEQLAKMVQEKVQSKSQLSKIEGVGESKLNKYADVFLNKLNEFKKVNVAQTHAKTE